MIWCELSALSKASLRLLKGAMIHANYLTLKSIFYWMG